MPEASMPEGLRAQIEDAHRAAEESAATAEALAAENAQLRASLERAVERAIQWQQECHRVQAHAETLMKSAEGGLSPAEGGLGPAEVDDLADVLPSPQGGPGGAPPERLVVLVGVTGGGKSSVGCTLTGEPGAFGVSHGFSSATAEPASRDYAALRQLGRADGQDASAEQCQVVTRVVDTVGFHDSHLPSKAAMQRFNEFEQLLPPAAGVDLFFFVLPFGRFSSAHEAALDAFVAACGGGALEHTILVFTHCALTHDELKQELSRSAPPSLRRVIPRLAFPSVLGVDLIRWPATSRRMLRAGIDEGVEALNGERYGREALANAME